MEVWKIIFLSKWGICRFQPLIFQGVKYVGNGVIEIYTTEAQVPEKKSSRESDNC